jgi:hypothetical protein
MAEVKISELPAASALVAGDLFPAVQDDGGLVTRKATAAQISAYVRGLAGSVVQVVQGTHSTEFVTTSTSPVLTGLTATITPTNANHKVLVLASQPVTVQDAGGDAWADWSIVRGSDQIGGAVGVFESGTGIRVNAASVVLDSPASTSAVTYSTRIRSVTTGTAVTCEFNVPAQIVLVEVTA